jgi:hypothetical protein
LVLGRAEKVIYLLHFDRADPAVLARKFRLAVALALNAVAAVVAIVEADCVNV